MPDSVFESLKESYPKESREVLFSQLGKEWLDLIYNLNYKNTCAIRLSVALLRSDVKIDKKYQEAVTEDGESIILKVLTMRNFMIDTFGVPWGMSKTPGVSITPVDIPSRTGIIAYQANWGHSNGHFDLWDQDSFIGSGNFSDAQDGFDVALWFVE